MSRLEKYIKEASQGHPLPESKMDGITSSNPEEILPRTSSCHPKPTRDAEQFLLSLLRVTPFFDLFQYIASNHYNGKNEKSKLLKLKNRHPAYFHVCFCLDIFFRFIVLSVLIAVSNIVLWKILI